MRTGNTWIGLSLLTAVVAITAVVWATDPAPLPPPAPVAAPTPPVMPVMPPPPPPETPLMTIGNEVITVGDVNEQLGQMPPMQRAMYQQQVLQQMTTQALAIAFAKNRDLPVDEKKFQKEVQRLRASMSLQKLFREETSDEKITAYVKHNPSFFDGTKISASHILITSAVSDSTDKQLAAKTKLEGIAKEIASGKTTFADAAKKHSEDPGSGAKGGDLGDPFEFGGPMVPVFTLAAFQTPKGKVSPLVRSSFGWHIIMVTDIKPGDGKPKSWTPPADPRNPQGSRPQTPKQLAQRMIGSMIENQINMTGLDAKSRIINHAADKAAKEAAKDKADEKDKPDEKDKAGE